MPEHEFYSSPVVGDSESDKLLGLFYRVDVEALEGWSNVTHFMIGSLGCSTEEPENTSKFRDFLLIMYGNIWEKQITRYTNIIVEEMKALITGFCKLTNTKKHSARTDLIKSLP